MHKIKNGSVDKSYGIHVAKLAKLPDSLITRANNILAIYENKEKKRDKIIQEVLPLDELVVKEESVIEKKIKEINPMEMTPMEALNFLYELKQNEKEKV